MASRSSLNRITSLVVALIASTAVNGAGSPISQEELKDAIQHFAGSTELPHHGLFRISQSRLVTLKKNTEKLEAKGDIFQAINERLSALQPGTEGSEREIFIWVWVLRDYNDSRGLDGLDRAASLAPTVESRDIDGGRIRFYPFQELARESADKIRVALQAADWDVHLKGLSKQERIRQLADVVWLDAPTPEKLTVRGAGRLLLRECATDDCRLTVILDRIDAIDESSRTGKARIVSALSDLRTIHQHGHKDPAIAERVRAVRGRHPKDRIGDAADSVLREIDSEYKK
ncbi:MAG: hypothetical protein HY077_07235 [Elusimicrobia bacterium]|nr:hypothetical protein [Elusimicrobiota bacterium]